MKKICTQRLPQASEDKKYVFYARPKECALRGHEVVSPVKKGGGLAIALAMPALML